MRYVAAYLLAVLGGNKSPSADDIKEILTSVGIDAEDACLKKVIGELKGKEIDDLIAAGREKLSAVPSGGGVAVSAGGGGATDAGEAAAEEEEKKEESEEEEDDDMGFGLFD